MTRRNLKSQIRMDAKRVFLNLNEFAQLTHITYYRHGNSKPPEDREIPIVVNEDGNNNKVWNRTTTHTKMGNDTVLFQMTQVFFCALEDFTPPPKRGRKIEIEGRSCEVVGVTVEGAMLKVEVRELEE